MLRYLLDTNICIFTLKNKPPQVRERFRQHRDALCISVITRMELLYGAEHSSRPAANRQVLETFAARLDRLDYDAEAADQTAQIRAELARRGTPIGPYDQMIAGHARSRGLILVTNNVGEFERVPGIRIEDWAV